mgnify:CR=1 FL=1
MKWKGMSLDNLMDGKKTITISLESSQMGGQLVYRDSSKGALRYIFETLSSRDQTIMMSEEKGSEDNEIIKDHEENKDGANMNLAFANHTHKTIVPHMKAIQSLKHVIAK